MGKTFPPVSPPKSLATPAGQNAASVFAEPPAPPAAPAPEVSAAAPALAPPPSIPRSESPVAAASTERAREDHAAAEPIAEGSSNRIAASPQAQPAIATSTVNVGRQKTENKTTFYPNDAIKERLRTLKVFKRVAEAFVAEDAIAFYFQTFTDDQIVARLREQNLAAVRRPTRDKPL